ncbi:hypothetical protein [Amycolatopsis sp. MEPSY49]|uniref:hypothetical protein n=1 Tax=Amycolatopsis sp. MEPSY49 TaxID=3151600 RepID=UPI003EF2B31B
MILVVFVVLNYFGVVLPARVNNVLVVFKVLVPLVTVVLFVASGFGSPSIEAVVAGRRTVWAPR